MLGTLRSVVRFEACCQWALLSVQITERYHTIKFNVQKYIYPSVNKVHAGSFCVSVISQVIVKSWSSSQVKNEHHQSTKLWHGLQDLLTCVHDHSYACVYTRGLGTPTVSQHTFDWVGGNSHKKNGVLLARFELQILTLTHSSICLHSPPLFT